MAEDTRDPMEIAEERIAEAKRTGATELDLSELGLASLPESLGQLVNLTQLDLRYNRLTSLPDWLGKLDCLAWLALSRNQLASLPASLRRLSKLEKLFLHDNPDLCLASELLGRRLARGSKIAPPVPAWDGSHFSCGHPQLLLP